MEKETFYNMELECSNCGECDVEVEIKTGVTVENALETLECEVCGCKTLKRPGDDDE